MNIFIGCASEDIDDSFNKNSLSLINEIAKIILNNKTCYENIDTDIKLIIRTKPLIQIESHMINKYENYVGYTFNLPPQEFKHSL